MAVTIKEVISELEKKAPLFYQENYDNSGLIIGSKNTEVTGVLLSLDCTEDIVQEAIDKKCNLIISHHPIVFSGLKKINGNNYVERVVIKAIQNNIALYACHTNLDNVKLGVNHKIADKLGLINRQILAPKKNVLKKLVVFVPQNHAESLRNALFVSGAGNIGNYDECSFNTDGFGTFRGNDNSNPFIGEKGKRASEQEVRVEVIYEAYRENDILTSMRQNHPYEEIAFDIYGLDNFFQEIGSGLIGELPEEVPEIDFLRLLKDNFKTGSVRHTKLLGKNVKKIALCGGSGSFLLKNAINCKSDFYVSSDFKYHEFFDAESKLVIADIGHYESEQFTTEIFYEVLSNKFTNFATYLTEKNTNPVNYF